MIGENIKFLRKTHDLTQPEFAKMIGILCDSLSRYEVRFQQNSSTVFVKNLTSLMSIL